VQVKISHIEQFDVEASCKDDAKEKVELVALRFVDGDICVEAIEVEEI